jgi:hypothetical protein
MFGDMRCDVMCGDDMRPDDMFGSPDDMFGSTSCLAAKLRSALASGVAKATRRALTAFVLG